MKSRIKRTLENRRKALSIELSSTMDSSKDAGERREVFKDPYGAASQIHDEEIVVAMVEKRAQQLAEVDRALQDIDAGRYGVCRDCGEAISEARLKVLPFATRCVACQAQAENERRAA